MIYRPSESSSFSICILMLDWMNYKHPLLSNSWTLNRPALERFQDCWLSLVLISSWFSFTFFQCHTILYTASWRTVYCSTWGREFFLPALVQNLCKPGENLPLILMIFWLNLSLSCLSWLYSQLNEGLHRPSVIQCLEFKKRYSKGLVL